MYISVSAAGEVRQCQCEIDALTGLDNRRRLRKRLVEEYDRARNLSRPLSVLALDLDHFRQFNAQFFLPTGDKVLSEVARLILSAARPGDLVFRDGGDQFTVVLLDTNCEEACREAERFRLAIASARVRVVMPYGAWEETVTVSVGVASLPATDTDAWELFLRARKAVHLAKDLGRNRVAMA